MTHCLKSLSIIAGLFLMTGCANLPDFSKVQANMDAMVYYMGRMSSGMPRMAASFERMEGKVNGMLANLRKKGENTERAVQNYAQAFVDNDRAMIKALQGIQKELSDMKFSMSTPGRSLKRGQSADQTEINKKLQAKLVDLEARLIGIAEKMEKMKKN
jgi:hypothetical protein